MVTSPSKKWESYKKHLGLSSPLLRPHQTHGISIPQTSKVLGRTPKIRAFDWWPRCRAFSKGKGVELLNLECRPLVGWAKPNQSWVIEKIVPSSRKSYSLNCKTKAAVKCSLRRSLGSAVLARPRIGHLYLPTICLAMAVRALRKASHSAETKEK